MGEIRARFVVIAGVMIKVVVEGGGDCCVFKWKDLYRMGEGSGVKRA